MNRYLIDKNTIQLISAIFVFLYILYGSLDFQTRCPHGKKTKFYKKAKVEKYCEYLNDDGLVQRISRSNDNESNVSKNILFFYNKSQKWDNM